MDHKSLLQSYIFNNNCLPKVDLLINKMLSSGLSEVNLSRLSGVSQSCISKLRSISSEPKLETYNKILSCYLSMEVE